MTLKGVISGETFRREKAREARVAFLIWEV